jgi:hypothetical protein
LKNVSSVVNIGHGAEEITMLARNTPDNFAAMCTHGRSGVTRWILGSVTESVVRHSGDPVLIIRAAGNISSRALAPYYIYRPADCESRRLAIPAGSRERARQALLALRACRSRVSCIRALRLRVSLGLRECALIKHKR